MWDLVDNFIRHDDCTFGTLHLPHVIAWHVLPTGYVYSDIIRTYARIKTANGQEEQLQPTRKNGRYSIALGSAIQAFDP